jgi:hypothetical protein
MHTKLIGNLKERDHCEDLDIHCSFNIRMRIGGGLVVD